MIGKGKILLGREVLVCPQCNRLNVVEIYSDIPEQDYLECKFCSHRDVFDSAPLLKKYGLQPSMSLLEKREMSHYLQMEASKI